MKVYVVEDRVLEPVMGVGKRSGGGVRGVVV